VKEKASGTGNGGEKGWDARLNTMRGKRDRTAEPAHEGPGSPILSRGKVELSKKEAGGDAKRG